MRHHLHGVASLWLHPSVLWLRVALSGVARAWCWAVLPLHTWRGDGLLHGCLSIQTHRHQSGCCSFSLHVQDVPISPNGRDSPHQVRITKASLNMPGNTCFTDSTKSLSCQAGQTMLTNSAGPQAMCGIGMCCEHAW